MVLGAEGVEVAAADGQRVAGRGHHHLFIDTDPSLPGAVIPAGVPGIVHIGTGAGEWTVSGLAPGAHRSIAVMLLASGALLLRNLAPCADCYGDWTFLPSLVQ